MIKYFGVCFCILLCAILTKNYSKTFSIIISIFGGCILIFMIADNIRNIINSLIEISLEFKTTYQYAKLMIKVLGITLIGDFLCDLCRENGEIALSSLVILVSKVTVIALMMPLFETIIYIVVEMLK